MSDLEESQKDAAEQKSLDEAVLKESRKHTRRSFVAAAAGAAMPYGGPSRRAAQRGARVRRGNSRGDVVLHARVVGGMQPGVLVAESIWPSECFEGGIVQVVPGDVSDDPVALASPSPCLGVGQYQQKGSDCRQP